MDMLGMAVVGRRKLRYISGLYRCAVYREVFHNKAGDVDSLLIANRGKGFWIL